MNLLLISLILQSLLLPPRNAMENPAVVSEVPQKLKKDYDKLWVRFVSGKEDPKLTKDLEKLLKKQKDLAAAVMVSAYLDLYRSQEGSASRKFEQALALNPNNRIALYYLGELAYTRNDYARASDLYARLLAVDKKAPDLETKYRRALLLATDNLLRTAERAEQENRLVEAEQLYRQALKIVPSEPALLARLAMLLTKEKKWDEALTHYRRQLELVGRTSEIEKNIAEALMNLGRTEEAREVLDRLRRQGSVDENLEAKVNELEDLGRWGSDIESFRAIQRAEFVTREQLAAVIVRYFPQLTEFRQNPQILTDIQDSWARAEIQTILNVGLIDPPPNHSFQPATPITRGEFAATLARLTRLLRVSPGNAPPIPVPDLASSHVLYGEVQLALGYGLMVLDDAGNFRIDAEVSGKEAVRAVERLLGLSRRKEA